MDKTEFENQKIENLGVPQGTDMIYIGKKAYAKKTENKLEIWTNHQPSGGKEWIAKITGPDPKYGKKREFIFASIRDWSSSGATGQTCFYIFEPGEYEINIPWGGRYDIIVDENLNIQKIQKVA